MMDDSENGTSRQLTAPAPGSAPVKIDTSRVGIASVGGGGMFSPRTLQDVVDFATMMAKAGPALPPAWRGNPGLCMATVMQALRWEMDPFAVASKCYVTRDKSGNDRIAFEAQLVSAVVNTRAPIRGRISIGYEGEGQSRRCVVSAVFRGEARPAVLRTPPISQIAVQHSPLWKSDPDQQLAYYGVRAFGRRHCPEVLMGVYTADEVDGMDGSAAGDVQPGGVPPEPDAAPAAAHEAVDAAPAPMAPSAQDIADALALAYQAADRGMAALVDYWRALPVPMQRALKDDLPALKDAAGQRDSAAGGGS